MTNDAALSVAICIPSYNQASYLGSAVESAVRQDYEGELEIWISDDASTDETPTVLDRLANEHPQLRIIRQPTNLGIAGNVSALMKAPDTELIVRLDSDDELEDSYVSRLSKVMGREASAGYGHTAITQIDEGGRPGTKRRLARSTGFQGGEDALRASLSGYRTVANVLMFRRQALERLDFYDGRPEFTEDYDLAVRMADAGFGNVYIDEPLARYRVWEDEGGGRSRRKALQLRGYSRIFDEVFEPAWKKRGWSLRPVHRQRRWLAVHHCASCFGSQYTENERADLIGLLRALGDGPRLELRIAMCKGGLGPWILRGSRLRGELKSLAKSILKR